MFDRTIRGVGLLVASAALVAACAGGGVTPTSQPAATTLATVAPATTAATAAPASQAAAGMTLALATNATLGQYVTGANGMTLYIFTKDSGTTSACSGACADNWPPLTVAALTDVTGTGLLADLGTITRDDGKLQVTLGGHPLYYFKNDAAAGDVNGQGINNVWYVAGPTGVGLGMGGGTATQAPAKSQCSGPTCY